MINFQEIPLDGMAKFVSRPCEALKKAFRNFHVNQSGSSRFIYVSFAQVKANVKGRKLAEKVDDWKTNPLPVV